MIEKILEELNNTKYDFRKYAPDNDPLSHLFNDWIKYYKLKYAICKILKPKSILETGVRFGYSAITFLEASPEAYYLGIDIDSESFGGVKGALNWARKITANYNADFLIEDTTKMKVFPGSFYDFIHVDAQQDGDGTYSDLEKAIEKGHYILVDGYFWTKNNMLSSTYFLDKYKDFIEYALIIPGYAGELLIKTKPNAKNMFAKYTGNYETLENCYDSNYYLNDCGGYDTFIRTNGTEIKDYRLLTAINLANVDKRKVILDIGSGRGELAYALSKKASYVIGIDYSKDAVAIARNTFKDIPNLEFIQSDILKYESNRKFDVILATDVVEHIEQEKLIKMFEKVKELLSENGLFIIHTAPNKLKYMYEYKRKYNLMKQLGGYIPTNPRSYYEDMMHINEQTPAKLNRVLKKIFRNTLTWTTLEPNMMGDFNTKPKKTELLKNDSIFSICSNKNIDGSFIQSLITQEPIDRENLDIKLNILNPIDSVKRNQLFSLEIEIRNYSSEKLSSCEPFPIHLSYHWKKSTEKEYLIFDGIRTKLNYNLFFNEKTICNMELKSPDEVGEFTLEITMVQEYQFWFEDFVNDFPISLKINVKNN